MRETKVASGLRLLLPHLSPGLDLAGGFLPIFHGSDWLGIHRCGSSL